MSMWNVKFVKENGTIEKHWKFSTKEKVLQMC